MSEINPSAVYSDYVRLWPGVHPNWAGALSELMTDDRWREAREAFLRAAMFLFGSIFYYIGLHARQMGLTKPLDAVACAGGAIQFLRVPAQNNPLDERYIGDYISALRFLLARGHGLPEKQYQNTRIYFSKEPKTEVAYGLLLLPYVESQPSTVFKLSGLDLLRREGQPEKREWTEPLPDERASSIANNYNFDLTNYLDFLDSLNNAVQKYLREKLFLQVPREVAPSHPVRDKTYQSRIRNALERRGQSPMDSSLFFVAARIGMARMFDGSA